MKRRQKSRMWGEKSLQRTGDNFSRLDHEMYEVLRSKAARDDYEKCLNYLQILRRYLFFRDNERTADRETNREIDEIEETRGKNTCPKSTPFATPMENKRASYVASPGG